MKERMLVMNGQKVIQQETSKGWNVSSVEKAGQLKPGIYNLYAAKDVDKKKQYDGVIIHKDRESIYQKTAMGIVKHENTPTLSKSLTVGQSVSLSYSNNGVEIGQVKAKSLSR